MKRTETGIPAGLRAAARHWSTVMLLALGPVPVIAQQPQQPQQPLSAIDWLDAPATVRTAPRQENPPQTLTVPGGALPPAIHVTPLGRPKLDSVGLLPAATTGLPRGIWAGSDAQTLIAALEAMPDRALPAAQALGYTLLLAEADSPPGSGDDSAFLRARVATLMRLGAVAPARALLERAGPARQALFDLWFDLGLLTSEEDKACTALTRDPSLSRAYAPRIYCLARAGDWMTAALTYEAAKGLGMLPDPAAPLLAQFLDPEIVDDSVRPAPPPAPSPLVFRLFEAIGAPLPTRSLPRAFAVADLRGLSGWKAELEAAERLARSGALPATRLFGLYTDRSPAASGGIWDRVRAVQALDGALFARDGTRVAETLPAAWEAMRDRDLAVPFAAFFARRLMQVELPAATRPLALRVALLSPEYEAAAAHFGALDPSSDSMLRAVARGRPAPEMAQDAWDQTILRGLADRGPAERHGALLEAGKLGEAILRATTELGQAGPGAGQDARASLATLRAVGLEDTARRAALQLLILGPVR